MKRRTVVVEGPLAFRMRRIAAARRGETGVQILTMPQLAARLAGGFTQPARSEDLDTATRAAWPSALSHVDELTIRPKPPLASGADAAVYRQHRAARVSEESHVSPAFGPSGTTRFAAAQADGVDRCGGMMIAASWPATTVCAVACPNSSLPNISRLPRSAIGGSPLPARKLAD